MYWSMGTDATNLDAYIENEDGNAIIALTRLTKPGLASIRTPTDAEWHSILRCIAAAPQMLRIIREYRHEARKVGWGCDTLDAVATEVVDAVEPPTTRRRVRVAVEVEVDADADANAEDIHRRAVEIVRDGEGQIVSHDFVS